MGNTREVNGNAAILARINKGWKPNRYLTNMSMAYFADPRPCCNQYFSDLSGGFFYRILL